MSNLGVDAPGLLPRITFSFQSLGWRRAAQELITTRRPYDPARDTSFDDRHHTDTAGSVTADNLGIDNEERRQQAILYLPSPLRVTRWMFDHVDVQPSTCTFVDLGCGKGRVLLVAAQRPFLRVVGFEISIELADLARANATRYRPPPVARAPVEVVNADVTTVDLPGTDLLIHLYHPFEPAVSAAVLGRLEASLASTPRRVTIAYLAYTAAVEPVAEMFARFPWLRLTRYKQSIRGHYNWMIYAN